MSGEIKPPFWNRSTFMIITGASQGIGKNLAIKFSRLLESKSTVLLLARSAENLQETRNIILAESPTLNVNVSISIITVYTLNIITVYILIIVYIFCSMTSIYLFYFRLVHQWSWFLSQY